VADRVTFTGGLTPTEVRDWYRRAAVAVNLSPPGLFDKAALEAMLTGVPVLVANPAFDALYGDHADSFHIAGPEDVDGLAERLNALLENTAATRYAIGGHLRERAADAHSLDRLMDRLVHLFRTGEPA
jgi:glycosyltransferase involved in cell wall biosynthesis